MTANIPSVSFPECQQCVSPCNWGNLPSGPSSRCRLCRASAGTPEGSKTSAPSAAAALSDTEATGCLTGKAHLSASIHLPNGANTGPCPHKTSVVLVPFLFKWEPVPCHYRLWASARINNNSLGSVCMCFCFCFRTMRSNAIDSFICDSCSSYLLWFCNSYKLKLYFISLWPSKKSLFQVHLNRKCLPDAVYFCRSESTGLQLK